MRAWLRSASWDYRRLSTKSLPTTTSSSSSSSSPTPGGTGGGGGCGPNCAYASSGSDVGSSGSAGVIAANLAQYYALRPERLSPAYRPAASRLLCADAETTTWLQTNRPSWVLDTLARLLRLCFSVTDTNAMLGRGQMFVLSTAQCRDLLAGALGAADGGDASLPPRRLTLLDVGAGDGGVTSRLEPLFSSVSATEVSRAMARRLEARGYATTVTPHLNPSVFPGGRDGQFDVVSIFNVLDRCDHPGDLLRDAARLLRPGTGRLLIAVVLPFSEFVEDGTKRRSPHGPLPMRGARCKDGVTLEGSLDALLTRVITPLGLVVERLARVPYLCRGDTAKPFYVLSDAIIVLRHATDDEKAQGIVAAGGGTVLGAWGGAAAADRSGEEESLNMVPPVSQISGVRQRQE
jgi:SAM-dependent methyltransferase